MNDETMKSNKIDIFKPRIIFENFLGAGRVKLVNYDTEYELNGGSPIQSAYNEAFTVAVTLRIPLYERGSGLTYKLLYHPDRFTMDPEHIRKSGGA